MTTTTDPALDADELRVRAHELVAAMAPTPRAQVRDEDRLAEDLGYDSLRLIELVLAVEERFGLEPIDPESCAAVTTVGVLADLVVAATRGER